MIFNEYCHSGMHNVPAQYRFINNKWRLRWVLFFSIIIIRHMAVCRAQQIDEIHFQTHNISIIIPESSILNWPYYRANEPVFSKFPYMVMERTAVFVNVPWRAHVVSVRCARCLCVSVVCVCFCVCVRARDNVIDSVIRFHTYYSMEAQQEQNIPLLTRRMFWHT